MSTTTTLAVTTTTQDPTTTTESPRFSSRGHVVDEAGNPLAGIYVAAFGGMGSYHQYGVTDPNGDYDVPCTSTPIVLSPHVIAYAVNDVPDRNANFNLLMS